MSKQNPRQLAFIALRSVHRGAFADVALDKVLQNANLSNLDRGLVTELVYGSVRRQRTLDALIDQLAKKPASKQPGDLRTILHLGLYQLRYLSQIPPSAAVNSTVELAKENNFSGLTGFVNGLLRQYIRLSLVGQASCLPLVEGGQDAHPTSLLLKPGGQDAHPTNQLLKPGGQDAHPTNQLLKQGGQDAHPTNQLLKPGGQDAHSTNQDPLKLPENPVERLGILHSFPDWIVQVWLEQLSYAETEQLCEWMNTSPTIDLRVNILRTSIEEVEAAMQSAGISVSRIPHLPQGLRLTGTIGTIANLPGFSQGWWTIQDSSAQLVGFLLAPQPGEVIIDACAAPGGKTTHIAELMGDNGTVWGCDRTPSRLKKLQENTHRLSLKSIQICTGDSRNQSQFTNIADRVLLDAPCSGLGTLHRRADARWRHTKETVTELATLQGELLEQVATWVKPGGSLAYSTCTLHPLENENIIQAFLQRHPDWQIASPMPNSNLASFTTPEGWLKVWPHRHQMDGFFMVLLRCN
jgi:16S rRNA (cytosine967-C5)-methyltransferase